MLVIVGRTSWIGCSLSFSTFRPVCGMGWGKRLVEPRTGSGSAPLQCGLVDSYSFQAPGFYERLGYSVFGKLDDYPLPSALLSLQTIVQSFGFLN